VWVAAIKSAAHWVTAMNDQIHDAAVLRVRQLLVGRYTPLQGLAPEDRAEAAETLTRIVRGILETDGPAAFESPRSAAIAHEVGHAIVSIHDDVPVEKIRIWKNRNNEVAWEGMTSIKAPEFLIGPNTPLIKALSHACFTIAGEVGERVLDPNEYRTGTALDEVLFSQWVAQAVARRAKMDPATLWQEVRKRSWQIIAHNESAARELISRLDRTETLQRKALTSALEKVEKIPDDWQWLPAEVARGR
jgi:hypothetical protein